MKSLTGCLWRGVSENVSPGFITREMYDEVLGGGGFDSQTVLRALFSEKCMVMKRKTPPRVGWDTNV